jgi:hypothetical protein
VKRVDTWVYLLSIALLIGGFLYFFERKEVTRFTSKSPEAIANPYLAAMRVLERMELQAFLHRQLQERPWDEETGTLFVLGTDLPGGPDTYDLLSDWVAEGGHLVLGVEETAHQDVSWLSSLGLETGHTGVSGDVPTSLGLKIRVQSGDVLRHSDGTETRLETHAHEEGHVSFLSEPEIFLQDHLKEADHAEILVRLAELGDGPVRFVMSRGAPSIAHYIQTVAWPVLLALGVWLATFLWRRSVRTGALDPALEQPRRAFLSHLLAAGRTGWRYGRAESLRDSVRRAVWRKLERRFPGWSRLTDDSKRIWLQEQLRATPNQIHALMSSEPPRHAQELTACIQQLEALRGSL